MWIFLTNLIVLIFFFFFDLFFVDDTDFSESEGLSSAQINRRIDGLHIRSPTSETEEESRDGK